MNKRITSHYFFDMVQALAKASTCRAQVGCMIIKDNVVVGMGYVGSVHGDRHCDEKEHILVDAPYRAKGDTCIRTIHAEMNAVLKCTARGTARDGWLMAYCTHQPCLDCTKVLLQIGVRRIWYVTPYEDTRRDVYLKALDEEEFYNRSIRDRLTIKQIEL